MIEITILIFILWLSGKWVISEREARYYKKLIERKYK